MKKYKILLVHNKLKLNDPITWLSYIIRKVTGGFYNHIAIQVDNIVIESIGQGVVRWTYNEWESRGNRVVLPMHVPFEISKSAHNLLISRIGNHYGKWDLFATGIYFLLTKRLGLRVRKPINGSGDICSELGLMLLGIEDILVPHEFEFRRELVKGESFETKKYN
jgi:hypothetical protein